METTICNSIEGLSFCYALQHIETLEYVCALQEGYDYLICYDDGDTAYALREAMRLEEHVDVVIVKFSELPFRHYWFNSKNYVVRANGDVALAEIRVGG